MANAIVYDKLNTFWPVVGVLMNTLPSYSKDIKSFVQQHRQFLGLLLQADVPQGASINPAMPGTAPGLICPLTGEHDGKVIYAVPGVPWEMKQMMAEGILPDLQRRVMREFPQARVLTLPFEQGPPVPAPIELVLVGPDLVELNRLGNEVRNILSATPTITHTMAGLEMGEAVVEFELVEKRVLRAQALGRIDAADCLIGIARIGIGGPEHGVGIGIVRAEIDRSRKTD